MTSVQLGKKLLFVSATAMLLAACSSKDEAPTRDAGSTDQTTTVEDTSSNNGRPDPVELARLEEERLKQELADRMGRANQSGLDAFAGDRVFFAYDSSELTDEARETLKSQAEWLAYHSGVRVAVEGHCDERGTREYNLALGERRANAVKSYLMALGVQANRLSTVSYGKERPAVVGNGEGSWSQNRRGVLSVK